MLKYIKDKKVIQATEKAYEVIYKNQGYKLYIEEEIGDKPLSKMKVDELKEIAKEKDIEGYSKMNKDELIVAIKTAEESSDQEHTDGNKEENAQTEGE